MGRTWRLFFIFLLGLGAYGQDYQESLQVNLVELEVKVQNIGGKFIPNLTRDDFVVKEAGKVQHIEGLEEIAPDKAGNLSRKSRTMILLDLRNTSHPIMSRLFPQLREYVQTRYNGRSELGLALYGNGIIEFTEFTSDQQKIFESIDRAETFFKSNKLRSYGKVGTAGMSIGSENPLHDGDDENLLYRGFISNHYRFELDVIGQFIRYLGAWSGKKTVVLISENWRISDQQGLETDVDREEVTSLRDIQTACLYQKVVINTISLARSVDHFGDPSGVSLSGRSKRRGDFFSDPGADLASSTSGFSFKVNYRKLAQVLDQTINKSQHYYLLRYYSKNQGDRFRNVKVSVKGSGMAFNPDGYYPKRSHISPSHAEATLTQVNESSLQLEMNTDWLHWGWFGWKKKQAGYAVSMQLMNEAGQLVSEQVFTGELHKKKEKGGWPGKAISKKLPLNTKGNKGNRVELRVIDLTTGKTVVFNQALSY